MMSEIFNDHNQVGDVGSGGSTEGGFKPIGAEFGKTLKDVKVKDVGYDPSYGANDSPSTYDPNKNYWIRDHKRLFVTSVISGLVILLAVAATLFTVATRNTSSPPVKLVATGQNPFGRNNATGNSSKQGSTTGTVKTVVPTTVPVNSKNNPNAIPNIEPESPNCFWNLSQLESWITTTTSAATTTGPNISGLFPCNNIQSGTNPASAQYTAVAAFYSWLLASYENSTPLDQSIFMARFTPPNSQLTTSGVDHEATFEFRNASSGNSQALEYSTFTVLSADVTSFVANQTASVNVCVGWVGNTYRNTVDPQLINIHDYLLEGFNLIYINSQYWAINLNASTPVVWANSTTTPC